MEKKLFIFILSLIIIISLASLKYIRQDYKKIQKSPSKKKITCVKSDPCFLYENTNRNQIIYLKLIDALKSLLPKKTINLGDNCKKNIFIQGTMDNRLQTEMDEITNLILRKINSITGFQFIKILNDTVTIYEDCYGNKNFIYNVFVEDPNEELNVRLYIDVIKYIIKCPKKKGPPTCTSLTLPGMKFEIGYPQPEQLIPLPTQIIYAGGGDIIGNKGINIKKIAPIRYLFINKIHIFNTSSVINVGDGKCVKPANCGNLMDTTLDSSEFNQPTTPFVEPACVRNKWPKLYDEPKNMKAWPCGTPSLYWDNKGIPTPSTCNSQVAGLRSSTTQFPLAPTYNPTLPVIPRWSGPNAWLFNLTRGDPATEGADFTN